MLLVCQILRFKYQTFLFSRKKNHLFKAFLTFIFKSEILMDNLTSNSQMYSYNLTIYLFRIYIKISSFIIVNIHRYTLKLLYVNIHLPLNQFWIILIQFESCFHVLSNIFRAWILFNSKLGMESKLRLDFTCWFASKNTLIFGKTNKILIK